jgi:hypothetical protein
MPTGVDRALFKAVGALEALGLPYALVGGLAVSAWVPPRATRDVDLYADLPDARRPALRAALEECGFDVPAMVEELKRFGVFRSRSRRSGVFLDIFSAQGELGAEILASRRHVTLSGHGLWVAAPESLVLLKVFSDRARDLEDAIALLAMRAPGIDSAYLDAWAKKLDESTGGDEVRERLRDAREAAGRLRRKGKR